MLGDVRTILCPLAVRMTNTYAISNLADDFRGITQNVTLNSI